MSIFLKILELINIFKKPKASETTDKTEKPVEPIVEKYDEKEVITMIDLNQKLSKNFILKEFIKSSTGESLKIDNTPTQEIVNKLRLLCEKVVQPVRDALGKPIVINSGYRCPKLNKAVKGAKNSQHLEGCACDMEIMGMNNYELACWIRDHMKFDQLILEYATNLKQNPNNGWVHVSYKATGNRQQCLTINNKGTFNGIRDM